MAQDESGAARSARGASQAFRRALEEFFSDPRDAQGQSGASLEIYGSGEYRGGEMLHEYLSFRLSDEMYAVSILHIREIIKPAMITPVPRTESTVLGILSLRGTIVPVLDLRLALGLRIEEQTRRSRILIIQTDDTPVGLLVDEVRHVIRLAEGDIEPPPAVFGRAEMEHIEGVGRHEGEMYTLLNLTSVVELERHLKRWAK